MHSTDHVIFAELHRDSFTEILQALAQQFEHVESGRQGDDWIWIHLDDNKIEIDSFYSMELEVKGSYELLPVVNGIIQQMQASWVIKVFDPPKIDLTR